MGLTRAGGAYLIFVLLVSLAAVRGGNNALYALLAVTLSAIVVSGVVSRNTLKRMALTLQTPDRIFAGKTVTTRVSLTNTKRLLPSLAVFVEEIKPGANKSREEQYRAACFPILRAGETRSARLEQSFPRRGRRRQTLHVYTRFPFGFFERRNPLPSQELLVYPAPGEIPEFLRIDILSGRRETRRRGSGENFYSIREHQDGESARAIDWKATAKARKLMAREYAGDDESRCLLVLDTFMYARADPEKIEPENAEKTGELFEKAVSLTAGLAAQLINEGASVEFLTPEIHIPADSGDRHLCRILEALALITPILPGDSAAAEISPGNDLQKMVSNQTSSIILTPRPEESFPAGIRRFARIVSFKTLWPEEQ
ncbi:MAG: DUF58 domain-containing protein [Acidobacteriota bacterium]|nr:DUF58 domain-containing protein [Acidobacteriota bacterium]